MCIVINFITMGSMFFILKLSVNVKVVYDDQLNRS